jgi:hypothetical protein
MKQRYIRRLKTVEMKFMRHTAGYSLLHHRRNENILEEHKSRPSRKEISTIQPGLITLCQQDRKHSIPQKTPYLSTYWKKKKKKKKKKAYPTIKETTRR